MSLDSPEQLEFDFADEIRRDTHFTRSARNYIPLVGVRFMDRPKAPGITATYEFALGAYHTTFVVLAATGATAMIGEYLL